MSGNEEQEVSQLAYANDDEKDDHPASGADNPAHHYYGQHLHV
jgi:hypothetical protein